MNLNKLLKKKNKILPYSRQLIDNNDIESVTKVLKSNFLTQGQAVPKFEKILSKKVGAKYSVAVNSATSALHIACLALNLKKNDKVWTTSTSFVATANSAIYCGAKVEFLDIDIKTYNLDVNLLEKKLSITKKKNLPKILIIVHLAGFPAEMVKIFRLSKKYKFKIIEDASHALGASINSNKIGNCKYSDICVFSFHPVKSITTGEGGAALTNDKKLAEKMRLLRNHGIEKNKKKMLKKSNADWYYEQQTLGFNYRMSDIHAALGISQLKKLNYFIKRRNYIAKRYFDFLKDLPLILPFKKKSFLSSYHLFIIRLNELKKKNYNWIFSFLRKKGLFVNLHYLPIHLQPYYKKINKNKKFNCPNSILFSKTAISIPIYPQMSNSNINFVKKVLIKSLEKF